MWRIAVLLLCSAAVLGAAPIRLWGWAGVTGVVDSIEDQDYDGWYRRWHLGERVSMEVEFNKINPPPDLSVFMEADFLFSGSDSMDWFRTNLDPDGAAIQIKGLNSATPDIYISWYDGLQWGWAHWDGATGTGSFMDSLWEGRYIARGRLLSGAAFYTYLGPVGLDQDPVPLPEPTAGALTAGAAVALLIFRKFKRP